MIRDILFLPIRLLGLVLLAIGSIIDARRDKLAETERLRIAQTEQDEAERARAAKDEQRRQREDELATRAARAKAKQIEADRLRAAKAAERVREAKADLAHLDQMRQDLRTLADYAERVEADAQTDAKKAAAFQRRMAIDQKLRSVDRQRERLQFVIDQGGR